MPQDGDLIYLLKGNQLQEYFEQIRLLIDSADLDRKYPVKEDFIETLGRIERDSTIGTVAFNEKTIAASTHSGLPQPVHHMEFDAGNLNFGRKSEWCLVTDSSNCRVYRLDAHQVTPYGGLSRFSLDIEHWPGFVDSYFTFNAKSNLVLPKDKVSLLVKQCLQLDAVYLYQAFQGKQLRSTGMLQGNILPLDASHGNIGYFYFPWTIKPEWLAGFDELLAVFPYTHIGEEVNLRRSNCPPLGLFGASSTSLSSLPGSIGYDIGALYSTIDRVTSVKLEDHLKKQGIDNPAVHYPGSR